MLEITSINLIFNNDDTVTIGRKNLRGLRFYGVFHNMALQKDYSINAYMACQSFELMIDKTVDAKVHCFDGAVSDIDAVERIKNGDIIAIEVKPDGGTEYPIYVPFDENTVLQSTMVRENVIQIVTAVPDRLLV